METSERQPLRVAVVGSGPAGFYVVQHLFDAQRKQGIHVRIDMFDRLATPFGLVRHGVAPDHQKIKKVTAVYERLASLPDFRFFGGVDFGRDLALEDLAARYHQIVFATGAQTDRRLGIPGEDLAGSHPATEFVAWYNGHPDFADRRFDLHAKRAIVIGIGNVAIDVARMLCLTRDELLRTDVADAALEALAESSLEEVWLLGRRGAAQAAFGTVEVRELGSLADAEVLCLPDEVSLDPVSRAALDAAPDPAVNRRLEILSAYASERPPGPRKRRIVLRFCASPTRLLDDGAGRVAGVELVRNELVAGEDGRVRARATDHVETVEAGLVFRSVGYRGVPLSGLPFRDDRGTIPHREGRVLGDDGAPLRGLYVSGWIKRGPSGVIGTNKPDALETVGAMLEDLGAGRVNRVADGSPPLSRLLTERGVRVVDYPTWRKLDELELARGRESGRPRVKLATHEQIRRALS